MSLYHIVFLVLLTGAAIEYKKAQTPRVFFLVCFGLLACMLCFRYGQGTDFFNYEYIYDRVSTDLVGSWKDPDIHGEPGWIFICWLLNCLNAPYFLLVFIVSVVEIFLFWRFINRYCKRPILALFLSYHTLYLTYFMSAMRQGLVIAIFLGFLLELLENRRYVLYYIVSAVCLTFHSVALTLFILPLLDLKIFSNFKTMLLLIAAAWAVGFLVATGVLDGILLDILPKSISVYVARRGISLFALLERLGTFGVILLFAYLTSREEEEDRKQFDFLLRILCLSMILYGGFLWIPLVASRFSYMFKCVEIAVICWLLTRKSAWKIFLSLFCAALSAGMYIKNINAYIHEGYYYDHVTVWNYPYVSILNYDDIESYRDTSMPGSMDNGTEVYIPPVPPVKGAAVSFDMVRKK